MQYDITRYEIVVPLSEKQWIKLNKIHYAYVNGKSENVLDSQMETAGADNVDFNGHFGRNIFFDVETLDVMPRVMETLVNIVGKN
jgi:hypothetical protein